MNTLVSMLQDDFENAVILPRYLLDLLSANLVLLFSGILFLYFLKVVLCV